MSSDPLQKLLHRYVQAGGEDLFAELVRHGGPLVWSVAMRRLQDAQLAEEAAQNVFVILAKKARTLASRPGLTAWLHRTSTLEASNLARSRRRREQRHRIMANDPTLSRDLYPALPPENGDSLPVPAGPWLDEALDRLPAADRALLLGRYFEKRGFQELARESGKSEPALRKQTERALGKLRTLLERKSVPLSAAAVAGLLGTEFSSPAMPAAAAASITAKASAAGVSTLSAVPALTQLTIVMSTPKATLTAAILILVLLGTSALLDLHQSAQANEIQSLTRRLTSTRKAFAGPLSYAVLTKPPKSFAESAPNENSPPDPMTGQWLVRAKLRGDKIGLYTSGDDLWSNAEVWQNLPESEWLRILKEIEDAPAPISVRRATADAVLGGWLRADTMRKNIQRNVSWFAAENFRLKLPGFGAAMAVWASADAPAAWHWIQELTSTGPLLVRAGADKSADFPAIALQKFASGLVGAGFDSTTAFVRAQQGTPGHTALVESVGREMASNGDFSHAVAFLAADMDPVEMRTLLVPEVTDFLDARKLPEMARTIAGMVNLAAFPQTERQALLREALGAAEPQNEGAALAAMTAASSPEALPENLAWLAERFADRELSKSFVEKPSPDPASEALLADAFAATAQAVAAQGNAELAGTFLGRISDASLRESIRKTLESTTVLTIP